MSLSVRSRPRGRILSTTAQTATVSNDSGEALFTSTSHGVTGAVFVYSQVDSYNGFWFVTSVTANTFKLSELSSGADNVTFSSTGPVTFYRSTENNDWNCVHQPIVYKLLSDVWPVNSVDTARTVSSFSSYNGYTALNLSGDIKATGNAAALEQVIISGTASLDGVYPILNWFNDSSIVINLPYSASNSFSGGTVQYYYFNYHAIVRVYAGLHAYHTWVSLKPYELVAEIRCVPDSDGLITVNVNEFIKKRINTLTNNLLLDTLPNNIDAFCFFYIDYAESYDDSDGYTVEQFTDSFTSDSANKLVAINCKLPFQNRYSSHPNDYVDSSSPASPMKFLTLFTTPVLFSGQYFDLSFINNQAFPITITRSVYDSSDNLLDEFTDSIDSMYEGVYRYPVEISGFSEAYITVQISGPDQPSELLRIDVNSDCVSQNFYVTWLNYLGGFDYWNFTARKTYNVDIEDSRTQEQNIFTGWPKSYGEFADTIKRQTSRTSRNSIRVESQNLTREQVDAIKWIVSSPLVQIVESQYSRRTIIIDDSSLELFRDQQDLYTIGFRAIYTDELPAQSL